MSLESWMAECAERGDKPSIIVCPHCCTPYVLEIDGKEYCAGCKAEWTDEFKRMNDEAYDRACDGRAQPQR